MPLYVRDERVNELAEQGRRILNAPTKTDAIRQALQPVVETAEASNTSEKPSLRERLKAIQDEVKRLGKPNPDFDDKAFLDEMWEI